MPRGNRGPVRFKEVELARALRAARRAGGAQSVTIDPKTGRITIVPSKPDENDNGGAPDRRA